MPEKTEAGEIEELLDKFQVMSERAIRNVAWEASCDAARQAILNRIRSIIFERDALRVAMQSGAGYWIRTDRTREVEQ